MRLLREEISDKKTAISTITKGIPFTKLEVRPDDQLPPSSFNVGGSGPPGGGTGGGGPPAPGSPIKTGPRGLPVPTSKASMITPLPRSQVSCFLVATELLPPHMYSTTKLLPQSHC